MTTPADGLQDSPNDSTETPQNGPETAQNGPETAEDGTGHQDHDPAEQLASITAERDALRLQVERLHVAAEKGVPAELLTETTPEAMRDQADRLLSFAAERAEARRIPDFGGGRRGEFTPADPDPLRKLLGR